MTFKFLICMSCPPSFCHHGDTVSMIGFFHHQSEWKAKAKLFSYLEPNDTFSLVVRWSHQLFSALSYLHRLGVAHKRLYGESTYVCSLGL